MLAACATILTVPTFAMFASPAYASTPFSWSQPQPVTTGGASGITHLACAPGSTLCVGGDYFDGDIAASANVTGGASEWITGNVDGRTTNSSGQSESTITGVACPSTTLCVATDDSGHILFSKHPAESTAAWTKGLPAASEGQALNSPTCPTTTLCVVADSNGTVLISTNPGGGAGTWTATKLAITPVVVGCETTTLCVAVSGTGQVVTATEPTGGESKWSSATASVNASHNPTAISCVTGLCAFVDSNGDVVSATEPTGGASKWSSAEVDPGVYMRAISCPSSGLCVADASYSIAGAVVYYTTNPHGGAGEWTSFAPQHGEFGSNASVETVACPSATLCVASLFGGGNNAILTTATPTVEAAMWTKTELEEPAGLANVSCASKTLCVALEGAAGNIVASTNASAETPTWATATVDKTGSLNGLTCVVGSTLCVATDGSGNIYTATEPAGGASKWTKIPIAGAGFLEGVSCPTTAFCAVVDQSGHVITSTTPTVGGSWSVSERLSGNPILNKISCPTTAFCAVVDQSGHVITSTKPAGGALEWKATELEGASFMNAIACASSTLCVAGDGTDAFATHEPTAGASKWTKEALGWITGLSCPAEGLCVASEFFGHLLVASNPTEGVGAWSSSDVDFYERGLNSVSCPTTTFCVAADGTGDVITGSAVGPANTAPPKISGEAVVGKTLTEEHGSWVGGPILDYEYEWQRCNGPANCFKIPGAEAQTLPVTAEDEGFSIRVLERARNAEGTSAPVASELTAIVHPPEGHGGEEHKGEEEAARKHAEEEAAAQKRAEEEAAARKHAEEAPARKHAEEEAAAKKRAEEETALTARISSALTEQLAPHGKGAKLANLLKAGGYVASFNAPAAGTVAISWYEVQKGAHLSAAHPVLVATGTANAAGAGTLKIKVKLTTKGKQLLRHAHGLKLTAKASFTQTGKAAVVVSKAFTLKH
jgi:hypothetical protein